MRIYFAGKIANGDWRHDIVPGLRGAVSDHEAEALFDPDYLLPCNEVSDVPGSAEFYYGGPFFVSCDHGCFHGPNQHGVGIVQTEGGNDPIPAGGVENRRQSIFAINRYRLLKADWVFAFIDSADCHGTLIELGMADAFGKLIAVGFSPELPFAQRDDMWMATQTAHSVYIGTAVECWHQFHRDHLGTITTPAQIGPRRNFKAEMALRDMRKMISDYGKQ